MFGTYFYDCETDKCYAKNRYYDPSTGRWLRRDPIGEPGFDPAAFNRSALHAAIVEQFLQLSSRTELSVKRTDLGALADFLSEGADKNQSAEKGGLNLVEFVQNDPVNKFDPLGLIDYAQPTCVKTKRLKKGLCLFTCTCPRGYCPGFNASVRTALCDYPPEPTCFKLDCWDYTKAAVCTVAVVAIVILSNGTAIPIYATVCAAP
jgi:hypothetical protein